MLPPLHGSINSSEVHSKVMVDVRCHTAYAFSDWNGEHVETTCVNGGWTVEYSDCQGIDLI